MVKKNSELNEVKKSKRPIMLSATRMKTFLQCKYRYWCSYVLNIPRKPNVAFKLGIAVHEALAMAGKIWKESEKFTSEDVEKIKDTYTKVAAREGIEDAALFHDGLQMVLNRASYFANGKILTIEDKFEVTTGDGVILTGAMDKVEEMRDSTLMITDYKTSKYVETSAELKSDIQLSIYDAVAALKYPGYDRIVMALDYLRHEPVITYRTVEERAEFMKYMLAVYNEMLKITEKDAVPSLNDMCNWCDYADICPAYKEAVDSTVFIKKKFEEYTDEELVKDYLDVKSRKYILDKRERALKDYIISKIKSGDKNLMGDGEMLAIRQNSSTSYDPKVVVELVPARYLPDMISVSKAAVDEYLEKFPAAKDKILRTATKSYTNPFITKKSLKK